MLREAPPEETSQKAEGCSDIEGYRILGKGVESGAGGEEREQHWRDCFIKKKSIVLIESLPKASGC